MTKWNDVEKFCSHLLYNRLSDSFVSRSAIKRSFILCHFPRVKKVHFMCIEPKMSRQMKYLRNSIYHFGFTLFVQTKENRIEMKSDKRISYRRESQPNSNSVSSTHKHTHTFQTAPFMNSFFIRISFVLVLCSFSYVVAWRQHQPTTMIMVIKHLNGVDVRMSNNVATVMCDREKRETRKIGA